MESTLFVAICVSSVIPCLSLILICCIQRCRTSNLIFAATRLQRAYEIFSEVNDTLLHAQEGQTAASRYQRLCKALSEDAALLKRIADDLSDEQVYQWRTSDKFQLQNVMEEFKDAWPSVEIAKPLLAARDSLHDAIQHLGNDGKTRENIQRLAAAMNLRRAPVCTCCSQNKIEKLLISMYRLVLAANIKEVTLPGSRPGYAKHEYLIAG